MAKLTDEKDRLVVALTLEEAASCDIACCGYCGHNIYQHQRTSTSGDCAPCGYCRRCPDLKLKFRIGTPMDDGNI